MMINKDSVIINGIFMGYYLKTAQFQFPKGWGKDSGRNLAGSWGGTLLGIFPKLTLTYKRLTQSDIETLAPVFDSEAQTLQYYDPVAKRMIGISTYSGDWSLTNNNILSNVPNANENVQISFIARKRRSI